MQRGATAGFKYFDIKDAKRIAVTVRGCGGDMVIRTSPDGPIAGKIKLTRTSGWKSFSAQVQLPAGKTALYFTYEGEGKIDFLSFELNPVV